MRYFYIGIIGLFNKKNLLFATKNGTSVCNRLSYPDWLKDSVTSKNSRYRRQMIKTKTLLLVFRPFLKFSGARPGSLPVRPSPSRCSLPLYNITMSLTWPICSHQLNLQRTARTDAIHDSVSSPGAAWAAPNHPLSLTCRKWLPQPTSL